MQENRNGTERLRSFLVLLATLGTIAFNWLAAVGRINGVTPEMVSAYYPTLVTPAGYAFSIWSLIYAGLIAFSIYQLFPSNLARFRNIRSLYILSCALNCAWLYFWHNGQIGICLMIIAALCAVLFVINYHLQRPETPAENWFVKGPFGIYFGWVTAATLVNFAVFLVYLNVRMSETSNIILAIVLLLLAAAIGVFMRAYYRGYFYPLAIAWALTAVAVEQSGHTFIVSAAALGVIVSLVASISFVMNLNSSISEQH